MSGAIGEDVGNAVGYFVEALSEADIEELVDVIVGFTGMAAVVGGKVADEMILVAWDALGNLTSALSLGEASSLVTEVVGEVTIDAVELVRCLGAEALGDVAEWAFKTLSGIQNPRPEAFKAFASCMEWKADPDSLPPVTAAAAVVIALNAAFNRYITSRGLISL